MRNGFRIGRIFGISIYIDWSWIFIFLLVTWNLAGAVFPTLHPNWNTGLDLAVGLAASLLFFASVLAHELAHSLVAIARGLPVRRITLFIFGGVSNIEREPPSPLTEFLVAVVGPLTSIVLGVIFLFLGGSNQGIFGSLSTGQLQSLARLDPISTLLLWLGPINIILGIFNLVPGFPLDGGRVLRSILWGISNNLRQATRWATAISHIIAWAFIITGVSMAFGVQVPFFGTGLISGIWLAFIGWFLMQAAGASYLQVQAMSALRGLKVADMMTRDCVRVDGNMDLQTFVDSHLLRTGQRCFVVVNDGYMAGMLTPQDVRTVDRARWADTPVRQIMRPLQRLHAVSPQTPLAEALEIMGREDVNQLPVVQNGRLEGVLSRGNIVHVLQTRSELAA
jgi:Zn-dependent protease